MEEPTHLVSPASIMTSNSMTPEPCIKMEDFTIPPPHNLSVTKPVKKRKSWGQELPEPKTTLPPRKRAKTDDEKEQRRIERIKRNRAAAHNSRERKRVEAEHLAVENGKLREVMESLKRSLAHKDAQLAKCKELLPNGLPEVPVDDSAYETSSMQSPSASSYTIDPRASLAGSATPATSPADSAYIKIEEPTSFSMPPPVHPFPEAQPTQLDLTQHSAAMLCDLQCQSSLWYNSLPSLQSTLRTWAWAQMISTLLHLSIMTTYKTTLLAFFSTLSPTTTARISTLLSTRSSTLTPRRPQLAMTSLLSSILQLLLLTPTSTSTLQPSSISATLAQHFLLATGLPMMLGPSAQALMQSRVSGGPVVGKDDEVLAQQKFGKSFLVAAQPWCSRRLDKDRSLGVGGSVDISGGDDGDGGRRALNDSKLRDDSGIGSDVSDYGKCYDYVPKE